VPATVELEPAGQPPWTRHPRAQVSSAARRGDAAAMVPGERGRLLTARFDVVAKRVAVISRAAGAIPWLLLDQY